MQFIQNPCYIGNLSDVITAMVGVLGSTVAFYEYQMHMEERKRQLLLKYNERYSTDENINKVLEFLILKDECKTQIPTVNQREMFLRFFEELEIQIQNNMLDADLVYDLFSFYALEAGKPDDFLTSKYENKNWRYYMDFYKRMKRIKDERDK